MSHEYLGLRAADVGKDYRRKSIDDRSKTEM